MNGETGSGQPSTAREALTAERASTLEQLAGLEREFDGIVEAAGSANADDEHDPEGATIAFERQHVAALLGQATPTTPGGPTTPPSGTVAQLIASAKAHYDQAQKDLKAGDFTGYAQEIQTVGQILQQLAALQPATPSASASASASPTPRASP